MKNTIYTSFLFFFLFMAPLNAQTIPNGGYENWITEDIYDFPSPYATTNFQAVLLGGNNPITKVQGNTGNAVRLESIEADGDVLPGVIGLIEFLGGELNSVPFGSSPDSVRLNLRFDIPANDTASVVFLFSKDGNVNGIVAIPITGSQNTFEEMTFNVPPILGVPDSIRFYATSTSFFNPQLGGFLEIDDIIFTDSNDQLPNHEFENWETIESTDPVDWASYNVFQSVFGLEPMVTETTDAYLGNSALRIETVEIPNFDDEGLDTIGFAVSGDFFFEGPSFPLNLVPANLSGAYKYASVADDSATIFLEFYKFDNLTGESEIEAEVLFQLPPTGNSYETFNFPLPNIGSPDSVRIILAPFDALDIEEFIPLGNVLYIDELSWDIIFGTRIPIFSDALELFPNPAAEYFFIKMEGIESTPHTIQITDLAGRVILDAPIDNHQIANELLQIDVKDMDSGMYLYQILTTDATYSGKVMIFN